MVPHWSLRDSKSHQIARSPLGILADVNNGVVWMVTTCPLIYKFSILFYQAFRDCQSSPITIGITFTFMFHILDL